MTSQRDRRRAPRSRSAFGGVPPVVAFAFICASPYAAAFPPYKSTDAATAGGRMLEVRVGLLRIQRRGSSSERSAPLSRINFGIGDHYEVVSELEYAIDDDRFAEGAFGFKWANLSNGRGVGVETLVLLPVHSELTGTGIETQFLRTWEEERWRIHANIGAFYDPRGEETERGWRGSLLAEFPGERIRPGVELFVRDPHSGGRRVQLGVGMILPLERVEIRSGLHVGLSEAAPDLEATLWLSWQWQVDRD